FVRFAPGDPATWLIVTIPPARGPAPRLCIYVEGMMQRTLYRMAPLAVSAECPLVTRPSYHIRHTSWRLVPRTCRPFVAYVGMCSAMAVYSNDLAGIPPTVLC